MVGEDQNHADDMQVKISDNGKEERKTYLDFTQLLEANTQFRQATKNGSK